MRFVHPATLLEKVRKVCDPSQQGDPSSASAPTTSGTRSDPDPDDPTSTQPVDQTSDCFEVSERHTSENLAEELLKVAQEWKIMLKRVLDLREAIISTLALLNAPIELLYPHEWDIVKEACTVLEPFEQVTVEISGEQYVTASKMIILCRGLQIATTHHQTSGAISTENITEMVQVLSASMEKRFHRMEFNNVLAEASVLDPRYKKLAFNDSTALDEAVQRLKTAAANCTRNEPSAPPGNQGEAVSQEVEKHTSAVWRFFDERATEDTTRRNPSADAILEIRSYLDEPRIQRAEDPLSWWKSKASVYPRLAQVMASRMCIVESRLGAERAI
ncbi:hypothetical protein Pcinc_007344 [Petrolisthes cinctipes]|uniref:HAT C-terminal dimerisation domain-containing protein n=1 Tax=Petrolisthes cinctipes TaxID=88211 RepID=A0AAE1GFF9_PETCI|nr:hypothetical protein Pcinc_007344 [Petrolisthes cinctipes]